MLKAIEAACMALMFGSVGGAICYWLHIPLPWTLGSVCAAALLSARGERWLMPRSARLLTRPLVGVVAGSAFTPEIASAALHWWDAVLAVVGFSIVTTLLGNFFFRTAGRFDRATAFFASSPGGLGEMTMLGGMLGGDMRRLVLVHVVRIVVTVFSIPLIFQIGLGHSISRISPASMVETTFSMVDIAILVSCAIAGYGLSKAVRFPAGTMVFALVFSAAAHVSGITGASLPPWAMVLMQIIVGSIAGSRFSGIRWQEMTRTLLLSVVWAFVMVLLAAFFGWIASWLTGRPFQALLLALAPGGMVEMTVITFALGIEVAFVVTCQVSRILLVVTLMPVSYQLFAIRRPR
jgi:membrane AbrB-like protein